MIGQKMLTILALAQVALGVSKCKSTAITLNLDEFHFRWLEISVIDKRHKIL